MHTHRRRLRRDMTVKGKKSCKQPGSGPRWDALLYADTGELLLEEGAQSRMGGAKICRGLEGHFELIASEKIRDEKMQKISILYIS